MRTLLINELSVDPNKLIPVLNYDGLPITAQHIYDQIYHHMGYSSSSNNQHDLYKTSVSAHGFGSGSANLSQEQKDVLEKAKALSFATEEDHEMLVEFMLEKANEQVVALLEKAQARIAELETEVEKTKEEFATAEHGKDGEPTVDDIQKSAEEILAENVAKALAAQSNK